MKFVVKTPAGAYFRRHAEVGYTLVIQRGKATRFPSRTTAEEVAATTVGAEVEAIDE